MEDKRFDRLIAGKMAQADVPQYSEAKWSAFSRGISSRRTKLNWVNGSLLALLFITNAFWLWQYLNREDNEGSPLQKDQIQYTSYHKPIIIYDTIYQTVRTQQVIDDRETTSLENLYRTKNTIDNSDDVVSNKLSDSYTSASLGNEPDPLMHSSGNALALNKSLIEYELSYLPLIDHKMDSLFAMEVPEKLPVEEQQETVEVIKPKRKKHPYLGPRWETELYLAKPFNTKSSISNYNGTLYGIGIAYSFNNWLSVSTRVNLLQQRYEIKEDAYFQSIIDQEPIVDNPDDPYSGGTTSGESRYTFQQAELTSTAPQIGISARITPFQRKVSPYFSATYLIDLDTKMTGINQFLDNSNGKTLLVESTVSDTSKPTYLLLESGLQGILTSHFQWRVSLNYWNRLNKSRYTGNLIGLRLGVTYQF